MTSLCKSHLSLSNVIHQVLSYTVLITLLMAIIFFGVTESNSPINRTSSRRRHHRVSTIPATSTTESLVKFSGSRQNDVDKLRNETATEMARFEHQNLSYSFCRKTHDIKCQEEVYKRNLLLIRQRASALQSIKHRLNASFKGNDRRSKNSTLKIGNRLSPTRRPKRPSKSHRDKRAATSEAFRFWDHGTIPYVYDSNFTIFEKENIEHAMEIWEKNSCVTFKEKEDSDTDYIVFTVRPCGCCSFVGRKGDGAQPVSLGPKCRQTGIVLHELGHAIGFWHEHTRPDRDQYVEVFLNHVLENKESNFNKMKPEEIDSLGEPYDFESIMHYGRNTLARNTYQDTILPKRLPGYPVRPDIGQRSHLSAGDIKQVNKLYRCASCGKTLHEQSGAISYKPTPGKPETCHWRIRVAYGDRVKLNITALGIPKSKDCEEGHLDVRDGANAASPRIGLYCGDTLPGVLHSTGRRLWLEYKTLRGEGLGFNASYVRECGGEIKGTEGVIMSPSYQDRYLPRLNCSWVMKLDPNYILFLTFEAFELENDADCRYDYLEIREGITNSDPLIGRYCGFKNPPRLNSTASQLQLRFVTDSELQRSGFRISFVKEIDECLHETHDCEHVCINTIGSFLCECVLGYELRPDGKSCEKACGGIINTPNGTISSPLFPNPYPSSKTCEWIIEAPQKNTIVLTFTHFDLEEAPEGVCSFDFVKVYTEVGAKRQSIVTLCGETLPEPITSKGNTMKVVFTSDKYDEKPGFFAVFSSDINECENKNGGCQDICTNTVGSFYCSCRNGFILQDDQRGCVEGCYSQINDYHGTITSPNYPANYPVNTECEWLLIAPLGHRIRLGFQHFALEPHPECIYDNLALFDGDNKNASLIGRYCGSIFPELVISKSSMMLVSFMSDLSVQKKGFEAFHDTVCGGFLEATFSSQSVASHVNYGILNYDTWEECDWLIQAEDGFKVELEFESFNLEYHQDCDYDSVTVYDGNGATAHAKKTFCGNKLPDPIVSTSSSLLVKFTTDNTINKKGFKFDFKKVVSVPKKFKLVD